MARDTREVRAALAALGRQIRTIRTNRELTQEEVADAAGLDAKHFQVIEGGRTNPTVATLVGVARALGVSVVELFGGSTAS